MREDAIFSWTRTKQTDGVENTIKLSVRRMKAEDIPAVAALERECFAEAWSENAIAESFSDPNYVFFVVTTSLLTASVLPASLSTASQLPVSKSLDEPESHQTSSDVHQISSDMKERDSEQVVGYVGAYLAVDELSITNVAVFSSYRRCGVADGLMKALNLFATERNLYGITLEVRVSNSAAIALYEKNGYEKSGIRKGFYSKPKEDALIMWKYFQQ